MDNKPKQRPSLVISKEERKSPGVVRVTKPDSLAVIYGILNSNLNDWKNSFSMLDKKNRGLITKVELKMALRRHELAIDDVDDIYDYYMSQGAFDYKRFLKDTETAAPKPSIEVLENMRSVMKQHLTKRKISPTMLFLQFDKNNNGLVSIDEILVYYKKLGINLNEEVLNYMMVQFTERPGGLNYQEFSELFWGELRLRENIDPLLKDLSTLLLSKQFDLCDYFFKHDVNRTGKLTKEEFVDAMSVVLAALNRADAEIIFDIINRSKQTAIKYSELGLIVRSINARQLSDESRELFNLFLDEFFSDNQVVSQTLNAADTNRDGKLTPEEWTAGLRGLGISLAEDKLFPIFRTLSKGSDLLPINAFMLEIQRRAWSD